MFLQTFLVSALSQATDDSSSGQAAAAGLMMSLLWLVACAFVLPLPMVSIVLFVLASILGFASSGEFPDLGIWGGISLVLAALSLFGWIGKRKERRRFKLEKVRQEERDRRMEQLLLQQVQTQQTSSTFPCPSCQRLNPSNVRFCGNCGAALVANV